MGSTRSGLGGFDDDPAKWLALAGILIGLGILPRKYKGAVTAASVALWLWRHFGH
jgi:hypothetical protein